MKRPEPARTTTVGRDLQRVHRFAVSLLAQQGLSDWLVFWAYSVENADGGGVTRAHAKRIVFSAANVAMLNPAERRDAVRHEVAHAIVGVAAGHSDVWRDRAIELGGTGADSLPVSWKLYPWYGICPDDHPFVSVDPPGPDGFACEDKAHDEPVPLKLSKRNANSRAFDPGVKKMAETYPEPVSAPTFSVGDTVYVVPFGSEQYDNAPLTVAAIGERSYMTRHAETDEEISIDFEAVTAAPSA